MRLANAFRSTAQFFFLVGASLVNRSVSCGLGVVIDIDGAAKSMLLCVLGGTRVPRKGEEEAWTTQRVFVPLSHATISSSLFQMTPRVSGLLSQTCSADSTCNRTRIGEDGRSAPGLILFLLNPAPLSKRPLGQPHHHHHSKHGRACLPP
ncbi:uncharacterized protein B0H64DRAFT_220489 [Chaetomium fimeti]|uniref:Secreted protein n=1 Tax=Chaetomium fimeti TaxID=1854472 RepID=A0AAE0H8S5_9PEZI|nr:hypothetical protein B0H64DRAFT_220489 [Chaetomium fimeti]